MWKESLRLRGLELKNRIVKAATHDGSTFEEMERTYVRLGRNDVAMITVAYVAVSSTNKTFDSQTHIDESNVDEWSRLCDAVHRSGAKMSAQLHHPGLFCMSSKGQPMGPSFFWLPSKLSWPRTMGPRELESVKKEFVDAARLCVRAGFDCIELHCGHGYLLSQFLTPLINRRDDAFGGDAKRRAAYPSEVLREIRNVIDPSVPVIVKMNADDGFPGGMHLDDALVAAHMFARAGADAIVPSFGYTSLNGFGMLRGNVPTEKMADGLKSGAAGAFASFIMRYFGNWLVPSIEYETLFLRSYARAFVRALSRTNMSVVYVGGADSNIAIDSVLHDGCIAVQLGRPLLREPDFVRRMRDATRSTNDVVRSKCIRCNLCTLASIDPKKFKAGCVFARGEDRDDAYDIEDVVKPSSSRL